MGDPIRINEYRGRSHQISRQKWNSHFLTVKDNEGRSGPVQVLVKDGKPLTPKGKFLLGDRGGSELR